MSEAALNQGADEEVNDQIEDETSTDHMDPEPDENLSSEEGEEGSEGEEQQNSGEDQDDEENTISSISELAEHLEVEPDWLQSLKVPMKVDGKPAETTIQELVSSYQIQEAAEHRLTEAKTKAQTLIQEAQQERESVKSDLGTAAGLVMMAEQLFGQDMSDSALAELRETDREEYLIKKDQLTERRKALDAVKLEISTKVNQYMNPTLDQQTIEEEKGLLIEKMADLEPVEARTKLAEYILTNGFTRDDLKVTADHRLFVFAEKARRYDEMESKKSAAKEKVAKIPKVMKPSATNTTQKAPDAAEDIFYTD